MRKITVVPILIFLSFYVSSILLGGAVSWGLLENVPLGDFRGVVVVIVAIIFMYAFLILFYRLLFFRLFSLPVGDNVTIGAYAVVFQGVTIGNNSIIAAGAVVSKNTVIGENEIWGGVPAKFIKKNISKDFIKKDKE